MIPFDSVIKNSHQTSNDNESALNQNNQYEVTQKQTTRAKQPLATIQSSPAQIQHQNSKNTQDSVRNYLQTIGRIPLLSGEEEIQLSRQVTELLQLEQICQQLAEKLGRQPSNREWAQEINLMPPELNRRLHFLRQAKNKMIQANLRLVVFIAKKYLKRGLSLPDLIQEGNLGLIRAVEKFEPEKGCRFSTYAYWWIRQSITRAITDKSRTIRLPIHIHHRLSLIKKAFKLLSQKLQRHPNEAEIAEYLDMTLEQLRFVLKVSQVPFSLEIPVVRQEDSRLLEDCLESDVLAPDEWVVKQLMCEEVETTLSCLSSQEQEVLRLRYGLGNKAIKSPAEVAQMLNLSRKDIDRIRERAMSKLRRLFRNSSREYLI